MNIGRNYVLPIGLGVLGMLACHIVILIGFGRKNLKTAMAVTTASQLEDAAIQCGDNENGGPHA